MGYYVECDCVMIFSGEIYLISFISFRCIHRWGRERESQSLKTFIDTHCVASIETKKASIHVACLYQTQ